MKAADIISQLLAVLPKVTPLFSKSVAISSLTRSGTTVTATTATPHGRSTGDFVTVSGATTPNPITSLTRVGSIATGVTTDNHDLTEGFQTTVEVTGATETEYNGAALELLSANNRKTFTYTVPGTPSTPATGTPTLQENKRAGYNGRFSITVTGASTFTYEITTTPRSPAGGTPLAHTELRVSGAVEIDRALAAYTKQLTSEAWAFVVIDDTEISRDRSLLNDATTALERSGGSLRIREIENFSIYTVVPATSSISGLAQRDQADDIKIALYKSIVGAVISSSLTTDQNFIVTPNGDGFFGYTKAAYIHRFVFQSIRDILGTDMVAIEDSVAFRDFALETVNDFDEILTSVTVDLDDTPLP
jgi:hypothetical protein